MSPVAKKSVGQRNKRNREKGAEFEREMCTQIRAVVGVDVERCLTQSRSGGSDTEEALMGIYTVEMKRRSSLAVTPWIAQATKAAREAHHEPLILMRADRQDALAVVRATHFFRLCAELRELRKVALGG